MPDIGKQMQAGVAELTPDLLGEVVRRLVAELNPHAICLFGSQAYGQPHAGSDIDLMVVLPGPVPPISVCYGKGHACLRGLCLPIELHFASQAGFERRRRVVGSLENTIAVRGRMLYAAA